MKNIKLYLGHFLILLIIFLQVLNIIVLILYRVGYDGRFLGVGGTWNLNEEKNPDAEIVASGVFVGFFIYTLVVLISFCFGTTEQKKSLVVSLLRFWSANAWYKCQITTEIRYFSK
jgi:hypothetical protein